VRFPRSGAAVDIDEFKEWLRFGLEPANRGHDGVATPIIDANRLVFFLRFVGYAREYCERHQLTELGNLWDRSSRLRRRRRTSANGRGARHDSIL
jgi:hypothetical protein